MKSIVPKITSRLSILNDKRRKLLWLATKGIARRTSPVFIVGSQRSGTGMLSKCLGKSPEFEDLGEEDSRAFDRYSLKDDEIISRIIDNCWYRFIVFKPLKDSHRIHQLLALNPTGKAIWAYRNFSDRINSAVKQFGRHPLEVFESFSRGNLDRWQLLGMSQDVQLVLRDLDFSRFSESDGAALMWWVRNTLYFSQELERNPRVFLWSYDAFVSNPREELRTLLDFIDAAYNPFMLAGVHNRSFQRDSAPTIDSKVLGLCRALYERMEVVRLNNSRSNLGLHGSP